MSSRRRNDSDDDLTLTTTGRSMRLKSSASEKNSLFIPVDLVIEILSRLPVKSIARCRCVSKFSASILDRHDFTELFFTRSCTRPQLLFAYKDEGKLLFFSTSQPRNPDEHSSPPPPVTYLMKIPYTTSPYDGILSERCIALNGLVFLRDKRILKGKEHVVSVICNPSTGQSFDLPKMKTRKRNGHRSFFGYDPIEQQFKVLGMVVSEGIAIEHQVLTLGTSWRKIQCDIPHLPRYDWTCVGGILYYLAAVDKSSVPFALVCFDVRSEKFRFINVAEALGTALDMGYLIDYNGKLGALMAPDSGFLYDESTSLKLWVLEDVEREEWSERTYILSDSCRNAVGNNFLNFIGVTSPNEIVLAPGVHRQSRPFYLFYFNIGRNTVVRVEIQGMEAFNVAQLYKFMNHVEDVQMF